MSDRSRSVDPRFRQSLRRFDRDHHLRRRPGTVIFHPMDGYLRSGALCNLLRLTPYKLASSNELGQLELCRRLDTEGWQLFDLSYRTRFHGLWGTNVSLVSSGAVNNCFVFFKSLCHPTLVSVTNPNSS